MCDLIWRLIANSSTPDRRAAHSAIMHNNTMYIFGGWNGLHALDDIMAYHISSNTWKPLECTGQQPNERNNHATALVGNLMYVHGGHDGVNWLQDMYYLDLLEMRWARQETGTNLPKARACHTLTKIKKRMYLFGGCEGSTIYDDLVHFDLERGDWQEVEVKGQRPQGRNSHSMCVWDHKLVLFGGHDGINHLNDLFLFQPDQSTWQLVPITKAGPKGMRGHTSVLIGSYLHIFGGYDGSERLNDLWSIDLETPNKEWTQNKAQKQPPGRQKHSCVCFQDTKLIVFGGFDGDKWLKDIYTLDLSEYEVSRLEQQIQQNVIANIHQKLFNNKVFSDFEFILEDGNQIIPAHKAILYSQSEYFQNFLLNDMQDTNQKRLIVKGVKYNVFLRFVEFLYCGWVRQAQLTPDTLIDLLKLSDVYFVVSLKRKCQGLLIRTLSLTNCVEYYIVSIKYNARLLRRYSLQMVIKNIKSIFQSPAYSLLEGHPAALAEVTRLVLSHSEINEKYL